MERTIISHDVEAAKARIRFEHNGVTTEGEFDLIHVIPGTDYVFNAMGLSFDEDYQNAAIERLTASIEQQIDAGVIQNPPPAELPTGEPHLAPITPPTEEAAK